MTDRYTLISADCHAGANHSTYRQYLETSMHAEFDAWRASYRNPFRDLQDGDDGRARNWDTTRRTAELEADGVVGEVVFPNTVPPFFPTALHIAPPPTPATYAQRLAGLRAHNRWLVDFCAELPGRRAGIGQIFLNDLDDAVRDVHWIADHGLQGGVLLPAVPPDRHDLEPLHSRAYDPLWAACADRGVVLNHHSGGGSPDYGAHAASGVMWIAETTFFSRRALTALIMSGVFERFPTLRLVMTEQGGGWLPAHLASLDGFWSQMRRGRVGELGFADDVVLPMAPSEYVRRNVWVGLSFPSPSEVEARHEIGIGRVMWGSDYPHHEASWPYTLEHLRRSFADVPTGEVRRVLAANAAEMYGFDLALLDAVAARVGPTVDAVHTPLEAIPPDAHSPAFWRD